MMDRELKPYTPNNSEFPCELSSSEARPQHWEHQRTFQDNWFSLVAKRARMYFVSRPDLGPSGRGIASSVSEQVFLITYEYVRGMFD
jgi:hypothetical protein